MSPHPYRRFAVVACLLLALLAPSATARAETNAGTAVTAGMIAFTVGLYVDIEYLIIRHAYHHLKGCTVSSPAGLQITQEDETTAWTLAGSTVSLHAGQKVRLVGKRQHSKGGGYFFYATGVEKDYGPCQ